MADKYYDYNNGSASNDGSTPALAKATRSEAVSAASVGDFVIAVDGIQVPTEENHFQFNDRRNEKGQTYRKAILRSGGSTDFVARTTTSLAEADSPFIVENLVFDGQNTVDSCFELVEQSAGEELITQVKGCEFRNAKRNAIRILERGGRQEFYDCKIDDDGGLEDSVLGTSSLSGKTNQVIQFQGLEINLTTITGAFGVIDLDQVSTPSNTLGLHFNNVSGVFNVSGSSARVDVLNLQCKNVIKIDNCDIDIQGDGTESTSSSFGILVKGNGSGHEISDIDISNNNIGFKVKAGYGIAFGQSTTDSHITGGNVTGNTVTGKTYTDASITPHNYVMGQGTGGANLKGNKSINGYVGYLFSITDSCTATGNLAFDCNGPNFYAKGTTAATISDNTAVITGNITQRDRGILAVAPQGSTDTTAVTFKQNLVIVQDTSKIHSLAYIEDSDQACTFTRNTYIIPDTVDVSTADLFSYENGAGGAANKTLAEWNATSEVTDDVIVQLPASEIQKLINKYRPNKLDFDPGPTISHDIITN
jgi:hypothetical protein